MNGSNISLQASNATNASADETLLLRVAVSNTFASTASFITIVLNSCAIYALYKCRRMPFQIKKLSCNLILTDIVLHIILFNMAVPVLVIGRSFHEMIFNIRPLFGATMVLISLASVSAITLERYLALTKTMTYSNILTERNVNLLLVYIWLPHSILPLAIFAGSTQWMCNSGDTLLDCDTWYLFLPTRLFLAVSYACYHVFIMYAYSRISSVLSHHVKAITQQIPVSTIEKVPSKKRQIDTTTQKIIRIVLTFEVVNLPIFLHAFIVAFIPFLQMDFYAAMFQSVSFVCACSNTLINLYLYVWKMKECRCVFLNTFFSWSPYCLGIARELKKESHPFVVCSSKRMSDCSTSLRY